MFNISSSLEANLSQCLVAKRETFTYSHETQFRFNDFLAHKNASRAAITRSSERVMVRLMMAVWARLTVEDAWWARTLLLEDSINSEQGYTRLSIIASDYSLLIVHFVCIKLVVFAFLIVWNDFVPLCGDIRYDLVCFCNLHNKSCTNWSPGLHLSIDTQYDTWWGGTRDKILIRVRLVYFLFSA